MSDQFKFESDGETRLEFPIVAVDTNTEAATYDVKTVHSVTPDKSRIKTAISMAYDYSDPSAFPEGHMVGTLTTDTTGEYKGTGFNAQYEQPATTPWETED